jgi:hypothetical protein
LPSLVQVMKLLNIDIDELTAYITELDEKIK